MWARSVRVGFRLASDQPTVATDLTYSAFDVRIGSTTEPVGSLSSTFAANEAANTILARSGPLTVAAGSLVGGSPVNPFYTIGFSTPFVHTGGDVLITLDHTAAGTKIPDVSVDGVTAGGVTDTVGSTSASTAG